MKQELLGILSEIITLLMECGQENRSRWFQEKRDLLQAAPFHTEAARKQLAEMEGIIGGMGSFTDLSLIPRGNSLLTPAQAKQRQFELAKRLGSCLRRIQENQS